jgi:DNA-binding NarL/FixJ family response regulator
MHKIFIVEDHPVIRQGYTALIRREADMEICGEADSVGEAMLRIPELQPDLVLVDISLGETNGLELLKQLHQKYPQLPSIVISGHDESIYGDAVAQLGAKGYLTKESPHLFIETIRGVLASVQPQAQSPI